MVNKGEVSSKKFKQAKELAIRDAKFHAQKSIEAENAGRDDMSDLLYHSKMLSRLMHNDSLYPVTIEDLGDLSKAVNIMETRLNAKTDADGVKYGQQKDIYDNKIL